MSKKDSGSLWTGIEEDDFSEVDANIEDTDIGDYNKTGMSIYSINVNVARHIPRAMDSLKMVERRILYNMFDIGATPGHLVKSINIVSHTMNIHNHGDASIYDSMVGMSQYWKKNVPLVYGDSNFGSITSPNSYAAARYTEAELTKYAYECFFEDYSESAVMFDEHLTGKREPITLPSKFPNVLVNGTNGLGFGFVTSIPPYNCNDVVDVVTKLILDPDCPDNELMIYPDFPTGCDIVDEPDKIKDIIKEGKSSIRMRGRIDIDGETKPDKWILHIRSIPYTVGYDVVYNSIIELGDPKNKSRLVTIDDVQEHSMPYEDKNHIVRSDIDLWVIIPRSLDPKYVRSLLFKRCQLEKTLTVRFTVIEGYKDLVEVNMRELINSWLNERRLYKRSLFNHRINKLKSDINIYDVMLDLLKDKNLDKAMDVIRKTDAADIPEALRTKCGMSSHQAKIVASKPTSAFSKDAKLKYEANRAKAQKELDEILKVIHNPSMIDDIIIDELEELRKYATPRKSPIITLKDDQAISASDHLLISTVDGRIKKLPYPATGKHAKNPFGTFAPGDSPMFIRILNNMDTIIMFDKTGKFSLMPVHQIPNSLYNDQGEDIYKVAKLDGSAIFIHRFISNAASAYMNKSKKKKKAEIKPDERMALAFLTAKGLMKCTPLADYLYNAAGEVTHKLGNIGIKIKDDDSLVEVTNIIVPSENDEDVPVLVYTEKGEYVIISMKLIPNLNRTTMGLCVLKPEDCDSCKGSAAILPGDEYLVVITSKGIVRKENLKYYEVSKKRKDKHYLCRVEADETVVFASSAKDSDIIIVNRKLGNEELHVSDIKEVPKRAKGTKLIPVANGDKIVSCSFKS